MYYTQLAEISKYNNTVNYGDTSRTRTKQGRPTNHVTGTTRVFSISIREYSLFFIKRSELQVSYERTLIAQITNY